MRKLKWIVLLVCLSGAPIAVAASDVPAAVVDAVNSLFTQAPDKIEPAPMPGFYQVSFGSQLYYVSRHGRYLIAGSI